MTLRRVLLLNLWLQLALVIAVAILANAWSAHRFTRLDLTRERVYSLDPVTRALMLKLERPLYAKVYFTAGLQPPYNNNQQIVVDKLEEMRAYSRGLLEIDVTDPTNRMELEAEAQRFGVQPIQYRYQSASAAELRKVYMGVALVYGEKQEVIPAITQVDTLEYDLARAIRALVSAEERKTIAYSAGHGEPDLMTAGGPVQTLRARLAEEYDLVPVTLGGPGPVPEAVDALFVIGPQRPLSERALYQLDQFLMRGGALALFVTNTKPDLRTLRPVPVYHGLEALVGHYGVQINRDSVIDRTRNGVMGFPVRQGKVIRQVELNYPLIPRATVLSERSLVVKDLESMLFPFASSLTLAETLPPEIVAEVLASSGDSSGRVKGLRTIDPKAFEIVPPGEERGSWPLLVALTGSWTSAFASREAPSPPEDTVTADAPPDPPRIAQSAPTRLVVAGSADFIANNTALMLNLADWLVQDESLIAIRSKSAQLPPLEPLEPGQIQAWKLFNLLAGPLLLLAAGGARWALRRRGAR